MNGWKVELTPAAKRAFRLIDDGTRQDAIEMLQDLAEEGPTLLPAIELRGYPDTWRVRFHHERFRMIYQVSRSRKHILVTRIRPRAIAYKGMKH